MTETLETKTHEKKVHCWEGLTEYPLDDKDILNKLEFGIERTFNIASKLKVNQYFVAETISPENFGADYFENYINNLKSLGLNLGKGDYEFGYKMPLPEKKEDKRKLIIFRRK